MSDPIEIAYTSNAGWSWRCWACDLNKYGLADRSEAETDSGKHAKTREHLIAVATRIHDDEGCGCDRKYLMSCPKMAAAILRAGRAATKENSPCND